VKQPGGVCAPLAQGGMRRVVVDLVECSFAIALTPIALDLAYRLVRRIGKALENTDATELQEHNNGFFSTARR
jgi:hypothetical protein